MAGAAAPVIAFLALFFALPLVTMVARGFIADGSVDFSGFVDTFARPRTWRIIGITFGQAIVGTALAVVLGIPGAYVLYRCRWPGRNALRAFVTVPFVLPTVVVGVMFRTLFAANGPLGFLGIDGTFAAIVVALVFFNYSVVVRTVGGFWAGLDPRTEQAARTLGASPWKAFRWVTLPALVPAITSAAAIVFLFCATAFGVVLIMGQVGYATVETEIWLQTVHFLDLRTASVLSVVQFAIVTVALVAANRLRRRREEAASFVPAAPKVLRLRHLDGFDKAAVGITAGTAGLLLAFPLLWMVVRSLRTPDGWGFGNYIALGSTGSANTLTVSVWEALRNSLVTAGWAAAIALLLGLLTSLILSRRAHTRWGAQVLGAFDALAMLPLGVSAVTVGFGLLISMASPFGLPINLRQWSGLVACAQAVVALPLVVRSILPVLRAIDPRLREVAATLGAGPWRVLREVDLRLVGRPLVVAAGFALAVSLGEFGATSFLSRPDSPTLPVVISRLISRPGQLNFGMAIAASVVLAVLVAGIMAVVERLRGPASGEW